MASKKWSKGAIVSTILKLHSEGVAISSNETQKHRRTLYLAAYSYFGGWRQAIEASGLDYEDVRSKEPQRIRVWSRDIILETIKKRYKEGLPINSNFIQRNEWRLYGAANKYWGGWKEAVTAAGIDYESLRKKRLSWSWDEILEFIVSRFEDEKPINASEMSRSYNGVLRAAVRLWGSWDAALEKAGIPPELVRERRPPRSEAEAIAEIQRLVHLGEPLAYKFMQANYSSLLQASARLFGSWESAVSTAGFRYEDHCRVQRWSPEKVIRAIQERAHAGLPLNSGTLRQLGLDTLYGAGCRYFETWEQALVAAGLDPDHIYKKMRWSPEKILQTIRNRASRQEALNGRDVYTSEYELYHSATYHFGSWRGALVEAGFVPEQEQLRKAVWDKEEIPKDIQQLVAIGEPMNPGYMSLAHSRLYSAALRHYTHWDDALVAAGINPPDVYVRTMIRHVQQRLGSNEMLREYGARAKSRKAKLR